jgi:prepilin peptidase CpaA
MSHDFIAVIALAIGLAACVTDVRSRRIPNVLTFGAAAAGLVAHGAFDGFQGLLTGGAGWLVGAAVFIPFFLLGGMGAGDVKLLAALGAWLGPRDVFWLAIYASLAGGVMAIAVATATGYLRTAVMNVYRLIAYWCLVGPRPLPAVTLERTEGPRLAYALPIFAGTVTTLWLR